MSLSRDDLAEIREEIRQEIFDNLTIDVYTQTAFLDNDDMIVIELNYDSSPVSQVQLYRTELERVLNVK